MNSHWLAFGYFFLAAFLSFVATISVSRGATIFFFFAAAAVAVLAGPSYLAFERRTLFARLYDWIRSLYQAARQPPSSRTNSPERPA